MSSPKNLEYKKTSFLSKSNSSFIEEMYIKYIEKDPSLPASWENYFNTLNEDLDLITKEIEGPIWKKNKKKITFDKKKITSKTNIESTENIEKYKADSIKAIALIRAYRIRGHLIANLDPLGMMERKYLEDLHPADHGFKKEDYNKKIFIGAYMDKGYATINEILYEKTKIAFDEYLKKNNDRNFVIAGGVAANKGIRNILNKLSKEYDFKIVEIPSIWIEAKNRKSNFNRFFCFRAIKSINNNMFKKTVF